jgi:hypothetical protein
MTDENTTIPQPQAQTAEDLITRAMAVADKLEIANKQAQENLMRAQEFAAKTLLGGRSEAGQKEVSEIDKLKADTDAILKTYGFKK